MFTKEFPGYGFITGAGSGIGRATAQKLAERGIDGIALVDLNETGLGETMKQVAEVAKAVGKPEPKTIIIKTDVSSKEDVRTAVQNAVSQFGRIDYAVNAAGIYIRGETTVDADPQDFIKTMNVNVNGTFYSCKYELEAMLKQDPIETKYEYSVATQRGSIVNIASIAGQQAMKYTGAYSTSKHAVIGITRSISVDHANPQDGIRCNAVCPGYILTPMTGSKETVEAKKEILSQVCSMNRYGNAEEMAEVICFLLSTRASYITGSVIVADGGIHSHIGIS